jgi:hypothetical protein
MLRILKQGLMASVLTLAFLGLTVAPSQAQDAMRALGSVTYTPEPVVEQRGVFALRPDDQVIRALRIESVSGSADILEVRLVYRSGEVERVRMGDRLRPGTLTNVVRMYDSRPLRQIEVTYVPTGAVTLVLRAETRRPEPPPPPPPPPKPVQQWTQLGCKNVGFLLDRDVVAVNSDAPFRALRLRSTGFDLEMIEMGVVFVNGQRDTYRLNVVIPSGSYTSPIDLRGERRRIRQVELVYRTRVLSNQKTQLCVDGLVAAAQ